jgi:hypothetical protein
MPLSTNWDMTDNIYHRNDNKKAYKALKLKCPCCNKPLGVLPEQKFISGMDMTKYVICCGKAYHDTSLVKMEIVNVLAHSEEDAFRIANHK